jgi:hypothetical protein
MMMVQEQHDVMSDEDAVARLYGRTLRCGKWELTAAPTDGNQDIEFDISHDWGEPQGPRQLGTCTLESLRFFGCFLDTLRRSNGGSLGRAVDDFLTVAHEAIEWGEAAEG